MHEHDLEELTFCSHVEFDSVLMKQAARGESKAPLGPLEKSKAPVDSAPFEDTVQSREDHDHERLTQTLFQMIRESVNERRSYHHVAVYALFVFGYMAILYAQSYDVVSSLREAVVPGRSLSSTFANEDALLEYIGRRLVLPIWQDAVCGDDKCQWPWEYPAFGRFGCKADCGIEASTKKILVQLKANFGGEISLSPRTLMSNARWNVCLNDTTRVRRGLDDICWFAEDQVFTEIVESRFEAMELIEGEWYVKITGDFARKVHGRLFDITNTTQPVEIYPTPQWKPCRQ